MKILDDSENLAYHAARLLIVINLCGLPQKSKTLLPGIEGRTLLAKLDFFMRYPIYLKKASDILDKKLTDEELGLISKEDINSIESQMVRYLYGPWDHVYYPVLAYLIGKQLIEIEQKPTIEVFRITFEGLKVVERITKHPDYSDLARRALSIYKLFNRYSGSRLKDFIYLNFPEVVSRKIGELI